MSNPTLSLRLARSRILTLALLLGYGGVGALLWITNPEWWLASLLSTAIAGSLARSLRMHGLRTAARAVTRVELRDDGSVAAYTRKRGWVEVRLLPSTFVSPWLIVLNFREHGQLLGQSAVVARDCLSAEAFRRLRVWLRWHRGPAPAAVQ